MDDAFGSALGLPDEYDVTRFFSGRGYMEYDDLLTDVEDDFEWAVDYSFPEEAHNNVTPAGKKYGSGTKTQAELYRELCLMFGGEPFIDGYFESVYPYSACRLQVDGELEEVKEHLLQYAEEIIGRTRWTKGGWWDRRYKASARADEAMRSYREYARYWMESTGEYVADLIRDDIIKAVSDGRLPLQRAVQPKLSTQERRERAGLEPVPLLFATGSLVNSVRLYVRLGGSGRWRTRQGIQV